MLLAFVARHSVLAVRLSLGAVFYWFGFLKVTGQSPVADLVAATVAWLPRSVAVPLIGVVEMAIGTGLIIGLALPFVLCLLVAQLCGTFSVFVVLPRLAFQGGNPLLLSTDGEFIVKNLVLISAALVVASSLGKSRDQELPPHTTAGEAAPSSAAPATPGALHEAYGLPIFSDHSYEAVAPRPASRVVFRPSRSRASRHSRLVRLAGQPGDRLSQPTHMA
jgi:uncharacterized membrane protein YkgB